MILSAPFSSFGFFFLSCIVYLRERKKKENSVSKPFFFFLTAFVLRNPLVASAVFGATKVWQVQEVVDACLLNLCPEIVAEIDTVHSMFPNPCA